MACARVRIFVYGSLKRGGRHHEELRDAEFLGEVETSRGYRLELVDEYLALVAHGRGEAESVKGELFEVDEARLAELDAFEGDAYLRAEVALADSPVTRNCRMALAYFKQAR